MKEIKLTQGKVALVDDGDFEILNVYQWHIDKSRHGYYARRSKKWGVRPMHRVIMGLIKGEGHEVDHINGNGLDNRRCNLRICLQSQNAQNRRKIKLKSSQFKGVTKRKNYPKWRARIRLSGKLENLGDFDNELQAAAAYNFAAVQKFGEFACLNSV